MAAWFLIPMILSAVAQYAAARKAGEGARPYQELPPGPGERMGTKLAGRAGRWLLENETGPPQERMPTTASLAAGTGTWGPALQELYNSFGASSAPTAAKFGGGGVLQQVGSQMNTSLAGANDLSAKVGNLNMQNAMRDAAVKYKLGNRASNQADLAFVMQNRMKNLYDSQNLRGMQSQVYQNAFRQLGNTLGYAMANRDPYGTQAQPGTGLGGSNADALIAALTGGGG